MVEHSTLKRVVRIKTALLGQLLLGFFEFLLKEELFVGLDLRILKLGLQVCVNIVGFLQPCKLIFLRF
jgi:hypothetical protein